MEDEMDDALSSKSDFNTADPLPLDTNGDSVLVISTHGCETSRRYLASSKVLSLASPVFKKMFATGFREGDQIQQEKHPSIHLEEDDPKAMETILRLLHYQSADSLFTMKPRALAMLSIQCDKYDLNSALRPWIAQWFSNRIDLPEIEDYGFLLLAAYMFQTPAISDVADRAVTELPPDFMSTWDKYPELSLLPESMTGLVPSAVRNPSMKANRRSEIV